MSAPHGNHYLLEIGTEELPSEFLLAAPTELADKVKAALAEQAVPHGEVNVYATPRRLALVISDLPELQAERIFKTKGPPIRVALGADGNPSQAGLGFARKLGVDFSQLVQETIDGETYMVLNQSMAGRPVRDLLADLLPELVLSLSGSHFMAWGNNTIRFSRPIRWLVSLWNDNHLPLSIGPASSDVISHGHRVLSNGPVRIESVDRYLTLLEQEGAVVADPARRKDTIWQLLTTTAKDMGGVVAENDDLLNTVTMLVENPSIVVGRFEERFLEIPEEVTTTVMTSHQKYFPVRKADGGLMPCFMTVSNGRREAAEIIRHGNEKVLTARLEDARFFYTEDQKIPLEGRLESLKGITFQKGLGSMYEKTRRLEKLALQVADALQYAPEIRQETGRAALLAKADLVTGMVFEFTELQGAMGRKYAALSGETPAVSEAIFEHYLPRFTGDIIARSPVGMAVSLADKIDTIVAVFSQKNAKLPSGSKDPLGLRRMASGIIQTILENKLTLDLEALMRSAYRTLLETVPVPEKVSEKEKAKGSPFQEEQTTIDLVTSFVLQRFRGLLLEQDNRYDIIDAVLEAGRLPLVDMQDVLVRISHVKTLTANANALKLVYEPANRIGRILGEQYLPEAGFADVQDSLFRDDSEKALFEQAQILKPLEGSRDYAALIQALSSLNESIERFFEKVMVNDPDAAVRKNRYNLLSVLNRFYLQLACFSKLVV
jgi:glycyl-tRNA synthetase beta chain